MAWIKVGDNASTYPALVTVAGITGAPEAAVREMLGWLLACSCYSAAHFTDYRIDMYIARREGGANADWLIRAAKKAGLVKQRTIDGITYLELLQDDAFIHIVLKAEKDWELQQRQDTRNPALAVPVRERDGDQCRYCGIVVSWMGRISPRRACFDHRSPGEAAKDASSLVVACHSCNSSRRDHGEEWDETHPLRPEPTTPIYGRSTARFLTENGRPTEPNVSDMKRASRAGSAGAAPRQGVRPAAEAGAVSRASPSLARVSKSVIDKTDYAGSGRDGTERGDVGSGPGVGLAGPETGQEWAEGQGWVESQPKRRRGSRGSGRGVS